MIICKVVGHVWATKKEESLDGSKLMVVEQTDTYGEANFKETFVVGAGIGERVLVVTGSTARKTFGRDDIPIDAAIVGIIDSLEVDRNK